MSRALGLGDLADDQPVADVVADRHVREERVVLEDRVDVTVERRDGRDVGAVEQDPALGRQLEAGDHPEGRRLARARRPEHREELAVADVEVDAVDGDDRERPVGLDELGDPPAGVVVAEALADALETDGDRRRRRRRRLRPGSRSGSPSGTSNWGPTTADGIAVRVRVRRTVPRRSRAMSSRVRRAFRAARHRLRAVSAVELPRPSRPSRSPRVRAVVAVALAAVAGCDAGAPPATPPISPGTSAAPREVNLIARDYSFQPDTLDLCPGETVLLHVINGGLEVHEAVIGDAAVQDAWEAAEAATAGAPPGPTPVVSVPPGVAGVRIVVQSGERVDLVWTVPARRAGRWRRGPSAATSPATGPAACRSPIRWVGGRSPSVRLVSAPGWYALAPRRATMRVATRQPRGGSWMAYVIAEPCIDVLDVSCVSVCPVDCIHFDEGTDRKLFIDPNECIDCGACEPECPVNAIFPEESLPPEWANYTAIDATWFTDKAAARAAVDELKPR